MQGFRCATVAGLAVAAASSAVHAQDNAAKAFGARPAVEQISLSPDGTQVALIQSLAEGQGSALLVAPLDGSGQPRPISQSSGAPDHLRTCDWVSNARLVCNVELTTGKVGYRLTYTRLLALNADGGKVQELIAPSQGQQFYFRQDGGDVIDWLADEGTDGVLITRKFVQEVGVGTSLNSQKEGLGVERVDTASVTRTRIEQPRADAISYITDGHGAVRIVADRQKTTEGYFESEVHLSYRPASGGAWRQLGAYDLNSHTGFLPQAVDRDLNAALGFETISGRRAVVRLSLDGTASREVVLADPQADAAALVQIGPQKRVVGAILADGQTVLFDSALKATAASLAKALPGQPSISLIDSSRDENRLLLKATGSGGVGRYYLFDRKARKLSEIMPEFPSLDGIKLAQTTRVAYTTAGGAKLSGLLTLPPGSDGKNLPTIVMPHGDNVVDSSFNSLSPPDLRPRFDWLVQYFAHQGFAVLQPSYGAGDSWYESQGYKSWRTPMGEINDAGRWLLGQGIAAPGKLAIVGWGAGGYTALQTSVLDPHVYKAIVAIAPQTDLEMTRNAKRPFMNFRIVDAYLGSGATAKEASPAQNAARIKAPVLIFHGEEDDSPAVGQSRLMLAKLKAAGGKAELVEFKGLDHLLDDSAARTQMLQKSDDFLRASLSLPPLP